VGDDEVQVTEAVLTPAQVPFNLFSTNVVCETNRVMRMRDIVSLVTNTVGSNVVVSAVTNSVPWTNAQNQIAYRKEVKTNYVTVTTPVLTTNVTSAVTTNAARWNKSAKQDQLFKSRLADNRGSKKVCGVYAGQDANGRDRVIGLGVGMVWVSKVNQSTNGVALGDLLISSDVPGHAEVQDDNIVRGSTLGRATEAVNWNAPKYQDATNALISCALKAG